MTTFNNLNQQLLIPCTTNPSFSSSHDAQLDDISPNQSSSLLMTSISLDSSLDTKRSFKPQWSDDLTTQAPAVSSSLSPQSCHHSAVTQLNTQLSTLSASPHATQHQLPRLDLLQAMDHARSNLPSSSQTPLKDLSLSTSCPPSQPLLPQPQDPAAIQIPSCLSSDPPSLNSFPLPQSLQGLDNPPFHSSIAGTDPTNGVIHQSFKPTLFPLPRISPPISVKTAAEPISSCALKETKPFTKNSSQNQSTHIQTAPPLVTAQKVASLPPMTAKPVAASKSTLSQPTAARSSAVQHQRSCPPDGQPSQVIVKKVDITQATTLHTGKYHRKAWKRRISDIRFELDQISLRPREAPKKLLRILTKFQTHSTSSDLKHCSTIPLDGRIEILSAIKCCASREFYSSWMFENCGLDLIENWLIETVLQVRAQAQTSPSLVEPMEPSFQLEIISIYILEMLSKLPLTLQILRLHKFGKYVRLINNSTQFSSKVKELSHALETKWLELIRHNQLELAAKSDKETPNYPTTTLDPHPPISDLPHTKHELSGSVSNPSTQDSRKRQANPSPENNEVKRRKIYMPALPAKQVGAELFGRAEKLNLPKFTNVKTVNNSVPVGPSAVTPNVYDPFTEAMGLLKTKANNNPMALNDHPDPIVDPNVVKNRDKKSKHVTFKPENELLEIKIIERIIYEGEEHDITPWMDEQARKIDACEGRYLHHIPAAGEEMEWVTPHEVVLTSETIQNLETSPLVSVAALIQEEREKGRDEVKYENLSKIPETANEPEEDIDNTIFKNDNLEMDSKKSPRIMKLSRELTSDPEVSQLIAQIQVENFPGGSSTTDETVADLLDRLDADSHKLLGLSEPSLFSRNILTRVDQNQSCDLPESKDAPPSYIPPTASSSKLVDPNLPSTPASPAALNHQSKSPLVQSDWPLDLNPPGPRRTMSASARAANKKRKKKLKRLAKKTPGRSQIPCKWGLNCHFGEHCHYKHDVDQSSCM